MTRSFLYVSIGVLCLAAAHALGSRQAAAEWSPGAGMIAGGAFASGGPWIAFTSAGDAWSVTPNAGWIRRSDLDLPVSASEVAFLDSNGDLFVLVTTADQVWELADNGLGWFPLDPFPGGPIATDGTSWGKVKADFR